MTEKKDESSIGAKTKVRLDFVFLMVCTFVTSAFSLGVIYAKLTNMEGKLWTIQDQVVWSRQLAADNPGVKVPAPEGIVELMNKRNDP